MLTLKAESLRWQEDSQGFWLSLLVPQQQRQEAIDITNIGKPMSADIKPWRPKRSLDANAYMWQLCQKISEATGATKDEVYRQNIREGNEYTPLPIKADAVADFARIWETHGTGWFVEVVDDSKLPGYKLVRAYHGSSTYDTRQMSALIDRVVQDAKALGIESMTPDDLERMKAEW